MRTAHKKSSHVGCTDRRQLTLGLLVALSVAIGYGCGPRLDRATVSADAGRRWPGLRVTDLGVGEGDAASQTWEVDATDSLGERVRLRLTYVRDDAVGWRLVSAVKGTSR